MATASLPVRSARRLRTYASFVRFEHSLFSLPLVLAGVFSVPGHRLSLGRWVWIVLAALGARTAALALNRLIDERLDALNPRTRGRELPAGRMGRREAWALLIGASAVYLAACAALGPWYLRVAPVPLAVFAIYPWLKRVTPLCHVGVGAALALAPLAGYAGAHPDLSRPVPALWLAVFALCWVTGFDIIYATLDEESDREHSVHSLPARLGRERALKVSAALHWAAMALIAGTGLQVLAAGGRPPAPWGAPVTLGLSALAALLLALEQKWAEDVDLAFFKVNVVVGFVVLAVVLAARLAVGF